MPSGPDPARVSWLKGVTYAHRGLHGECRVENSPSAFRAAIAAGLGIECDVQLTADDAALVFHDGDLGRLTGRQGSVRGHTTQALAAMELAGGDPIWTLPELLAEVAGRAPLLVEIKSRAELPMARLCRAVAKALRHYSGPVAVMSFDPQVVRWFAVNAPEIVRGLVNSEEGEGESYPVSRGILARRFARAEFVACDVRDLPSRFAAAMRESGLPVLAWTVSDAARLAAAREHADAPIAEGDGLELALRNA